MTKQRYRLTKDDDGHTYLVPAEKAEEFGELCDEAYASDDFTAFERKFGKYRIGDAHALTFTDPRGFDGEPLGG